MKITRMFIILIALYASFGWADINSPANLRNLAKDTLKKYNEQITKNGPNVPAPNLGTTVKALVERISTDKEIAARAKADPAFAALQTQTLNHLRHVSLDFKMESKDYTHDYVLKGPYPAEPTIKALGKAADFFDIMQAKPNSIQPTVSKPAMSESEARALDKSFVEKMTSDTWNTYQTLRGRLKSKGVEAPFPELKGTVAFLETKLNSESVLADSKKSPVIAAMREKALHSLTEIQAKNLPYKSTVDAIERAVEFFDVQQRGQNPKTSPPLYHSGRYEYYNHYLVAQAPDHLILPTVTELTMTDLLKVRGVPVGYAGVNADTVRVDGYHQTPYEFYMHDINHSRRMLQFSKEQAGADGISEQDFFRKSNDYVQNKLIPIITPSPNDDGNARDQKKMKEAILFEVLHEDALPPKKEVIEKAVQRDAGHRTPFETMEGNTVRYVMEPGATTLAYTFRKLAHTFYDAPENRDGSMLEPEKRTRENVVNAADSLFKELDIKDIPRSRLQSYTNTDVGFPDAFKQELVDDIKKRGKSSQVVPLNEKSSEAKNQVIFSNDESPKFSNIEKMTSAADYFFNSQSTAAADRRHLILGEVNEAQFKKFLESFFGQKKLTVVHLEIGAALKSNISDTSFHGASFFAKYLAQFPELIDEMEKRGIKLMVVDASSGRHYSSVKDYYKSPDWKTQLHKFARSRNDVATDDFLKKKKMLSDLEEKVKAEIDKVKKDQLIKQLQTVKNDIYLTENRTNSDSLVLKALQDTLKNVKGTDNPLLEKVTRAGYNAEILQRKSGVIVDPAEAASKAAKGVR